MWHVKHSGASLAFTFRPFAFAISSAFGVVKVLNALACLDDFQMSNCFPCFSVLWHAEHMVTPTYLCWAREGIARNNARATTTATSTDLFIYRQFPFGSNC